MSVVYDCRSFSINAKLAAEIKDAKDGFIFRNGIEYGWTVIGGKRLLYACIWIHIGYFNWNYPHNGFSREYIDFLSKYKEV